MLTRHKITADCVARHWDAGLIFRAQDVKGSCSQVRLFRWGNDSRSEKDAAGHSFHNDLRQIKVPIKGSKVTEKTRSDHVCCATTKKGNLMTKSAWMREQSDDATS